MASSDGPGEGDAAPGLRSCDAPGRLTQLTPAPAAAASTASPSTTTLSAPTPGPTLRFGPTTADLLFSFNVNPGFDAIVRRQVSPGSCYRPPRFEPGGAQPDWRLPCRTRAGAHAEPAAYRSRRCRRLSLYRGDASLTNARRGFFLVYVNSFNEWHEGHQFEPMRNFDDLADRASGRSATTTPRTATTGSSTSACVLATFCRDRSEARETPAMSSLAFDGCAGEGGLPWIRPLANRHGEQAIAAPHADDVRGELRSGQLASAAPGHGAAAARNGRDRSGRLESARATCPAWAPRRGVRAR